MLRSGKVEQLKTQTQLLTVGGGREGKRSKRKRGGAGRGAEEEVLGRDDGRDYQE